MEKTFYWHNVTVQFITEDEKTSKLKKIKENYLVKGVNPTDVETQVVKDLDGVQMDYTIEGITKSKIVRIIHPDNVELNG